MEHEITRNRMKELKERRKKMQKSPTQHPQSPTDNSSKESLFDTGSICGSAALSPLRSEPGSPKRSLSTNSSSSKSDFVIRFCITKKSVHMLKIFSCCWTQGFLPESSHWKRIKCKRIYTVSHLSIIKKPWFLVLLHCSWNHSTSWSPSTRFVHTTSKSWRTWKTQKGACGY